MGLRELRRAKRIPKRQGAWIATIAGGGRLPCTLWDISELGARIAVPRPKSLPPGFVLMLTHDGRSRRCCRIVWRSGTQVGVQFIERLDAEHVWPSRRDQPGPAIAETVAAVTQGKAPPIPANLLRLSGNTAAGGRARGAFSLLATMLCLGVIAGAAALLVAQFFPDQEQIPLVSQVCAGSNVFCSHPVIPGITALLVILVLIAAKRMKPE
jgi:hypothetical protein